MKKNNLIILLLIIFIGCDIFNVRPSEKPDQNSNNTLKAYSSDDLLKNFELAYNTRSIQLYNSCFDNELGFNYKPLNQSLISYPNLENWNVSKELNYFSNLVNDKSDEKIENIFLNLKNEYSERDISTAKVKIEYFLKLVKFNKDTIIAKGLIYLNLYRTNSENWIIKNWEEINKTTDISWGDIKGKYAF